MSDIRGAPLGVFAIERFTEAECMRGESFAIPESAPVRDLLQGAFGPHLPDRDGPHDVVIDFSAAKAPLVATRDWHPTQTVTNLPDGRVRVALRVPSLAPIVSWVLEWGPHTRAIALDSLVEAVVRELDGARAQY